VFHCANSIKKYNTPPTATQGDGHARPANAGDMTALERTSLSTARRRSASGGKGNWKAGRSKHSGARASKAQRESKGFGDSYQAQQGSRPDLDATIVGKHIEVATRVVEYTLQVGVS
jgi:hypothetical protein